MSTVAADIGYGYTKVRARGIKEIFASVVGTPEVGRFGLDNQSDHILTVNGMRCIVGDLAVEQSRFLTRREDRSWIETDEYMALVHNALLLAKAPLPFRMVTGLPIAFYDDKGRLAELLKGRHIINNGSAHIAYARDVSVIPQPFGSLFAYSLLSDGGVRDATMLTGKVGVVDVGSKTTNLLTASRGRDVEGSTDSIALGGWDIVRAVRSELETVCPGADWRDHDLARAVQLGHIEYMGETVSLREMIADIVTPFAEQVKAAASSLWNGGGTLAAILVTGGGAHLIGDHIKELYNRHKRVIIMDNPVFANVEGYYRYGLFLEKSGK
jgi:plasmid segregation protein ParM